MTCCLRCGEDLGGRLYKVSYVVPYNECRGKTCPDCGKVRKVGWYEEICTENPQYYHPCVKCKKTVSHWINKVCSKCFFERERKRGCTCFWDSDYNKKEGHHNNINYYCPICEDVHPRESLCKKCFEKQMGTYQQVTFLKAVLPTAIISLVVGFFLGWLFFRRLRKVKKKPK